MDYLKYAIRKKYIASAKSYLVPKVLILWDTDVVFRVKLISTYFAFLDYLIMSFLEIEIQSNITNIKKRKQDIQHNKKQRIYTIKD